MILWHVIFWAVLTVILIASEIATVQLVAIWFAAGSLAAFVSSFFGIPFYVQVIIFIAGSILLLLLTRPLVRRFIHDKKVRTNADRVIGKECVVKEPIDNINGSGRVYVDGLTWTARSSDDTVTYPEGTTCVVTEIQGVKLIVKAAG